MPLQPKIIVTIDAQGNTSVKAEGFAGKSCVAATREIEHALGQVTADRKTPEYLQNAATSQGRSLSQ